MPSVSKPQATLMAMAARNPAVAKRRGIPQHVARDFHRADQRSGILKRSAGGSTPLESGLDSHLNFGMGHGHNFFSTNPLLGHALSGTQLGQKRYAEGGKVNKPSKPAGPSAKERREIRALVERGKQDAVSALRASRDALLGAQPAPGEEMQDFSEPLARLQRKLAMADGGEVAARATYASGPPQLYQEYMSLLDQLQQPETDADIQMQLIDRLAAIQAQLEQVGIDVGAGEAPE